MTIVWDGAIAGPLYADNFVWPTPTAYSDGAGNIVVTQTTTTMHTNRLEIRNCTSLKIPPNGYLSAQTNSTTEAGEVIIIGDPENPCVIDSVSGQFQTLSVAPAHTGAIPKLEIYSAEIKNAGQAPGFPAVSGTAGGSGRQFKLVVWDTKIHLCKADLINVVTGIQTVTGPVDIRRCQLIACGTDGDKLRQAIQLDGLDAGAKVTVDHCSFLFRSLRTAGRQDTISIGNNVELTLTNNIITQENTDGVQVSRVVDITGTGTVVNNNNFIYTYVEAQDLGSLVLDSTDQAADPGYYNSACATPDLRPNAANGTPDLWEADSIGWHPGALEPHNLVATLSGTTDEVISAGTDCVYASSKQRVYEGSFATPTSKGHRGRGVRLQLKSTDHKGQRTFAGAWVEFIPESRG